MKRSKELGVILLCKLLQSNKPWISAYILQGNLPSANHQFHTSSTTLKHFSRFAKVYKAWAFYRKQLVKVCFGTSNHPSLSISHAMLKAFKLSIYLSMYLYKQTFLYLSIFLSIMYLYLYRQAFLWSWALSI